MSEGGKDVGWRMTPQTALKRERGGTSARTHRPHAPLPRHLSTRAAQQIAGRWRMPLHRSLRSRRQSRVGDRRELRGLPERRPRPSAPPPVGWLRGSLTAAAPCTSAPPAQPRLAGSLFTAEGVKRRRSRQPFSASQSTLRGGCCGVSALFAPRSKAGAEVEPLAEEKLVGAARLEGRRSGCGGGVAPVAQRCA